MSRRRYRDDFRAAALAALTANAGNVARTARQLGLSRKTLEGWATGRTPSPPAHLRHQKKAALADALEALARRMLDAMTAEKIKAATLLEIAVALGVCVDKMAQLRAPSP
jgi:transposase-like protein